MTEKMDHLEERVQSDLLELPDNLDPQAVLEDVEIKVTLDHREQTEDRAQQDQ